MTVLKVTRHVFAAILLLAAGSVAQALTLSVNCGSKEGLASIGAALRVLQGPLASPPNTINVSGSCHENILIQNMDRLTLNAIKGAAITDTSYGTREVIDVDGSHGFILSGFTITTTCPSSCMSGAGADAISCFDGADCLLINNTISGAANGSGVGVYAVSKVTVQGGLLQNNYYGLFTNDSGEASLSGVKIQNNINGVALNHGGSVAIRGGTDGVTPSVIANNTARGIDTNIGATVIVKGLTDINSNGAEGIYLALGSKLFVGGGGPGTAAITGNAGAGVSINDASIAAFAANAHVTGNASPNVACNAATVVTVGAVAAAGGVPGLPNTSCTN